MTYTQCIIFIYFDCKSTTNMKILIVLLVLLFWAQGFKVHTTSAQYVKVLFSKAPNLGFSNYTDPSVTEDQLRTIINFIKAASGFHKDDVLANIKYLKDNLDKLYTEDGTSFFILIQTQNSTYSSTSQLWQPNNFIVSLSDVNIINPSWSYFIYKVFNASPHFTTAYAFINKGSVSPSLTREQQDYIMSVIKKYEPDTFVCHCQNVGSIQDDLSDHFSKLWSVACDSSGSINAYVNTMNGHWGSFATNKCYYTMFEYFAFC